MLHLFSVLVALSTAVLIFAGGMVTSTGSGLSVPDWPNTYGWFMLTFPLEKMVGGIFYEHTHRLIASTVGFLILVQAVWLWRVEPRTWVRRLGYVALAAVITQGILGGITVLFFLPDPVSIAHASLAQIVFCLTVTIALATSRGWARGYVRSRRSEVRSQGSEVRSQRSEARSQRSEVRGQRSEVGREASLSPDVWPLASDRALGKLAVFTTAAIYLQIVVGATMRHTDAGLAIPDFPLAFGQLIPPQWDPKIAIHFAHRVGALIVSMLIAALAGHVFYHHRARRELARPAGLLLALLVVQITLGALTVLTAKHYVINSLHVVTGACLLVTMVVMTLRAHRARFAHGEDERAYSTGFAPPANSRAHA